jgi:hypothetical protein
MMMSWGDVRKAIAVHTHFLILYNIHFCHGFIHNMAAFTLCKESDGWYLIVCRSL